MSLRFTLLAALSVHVAGGVWFFLSCHNVVDMHHDDALHDDHPEACIPDTWGSHEGIIEYSIAIIFFVLWCILEFCKVNFVTLNTQ